MREHSPVVIDKFLGLYDRGDEDECPIDHFTDCENVKFVGNGSIATRDGIGISQSVAVPLQDVKRIYNFPTQTANTLIVLVENDSGEGEIYHVINATTVFGPILTIAGMVDFAFVPYAGRGYISPFGTFLVGELNQEKGLDNEFLYVYLGDGTPARKAAGTAPTGNMTIANGAAGHTDAGVHVFGIVYETNTGYLTAPGALESFTTSAALSVSFGNLPVGDATVIRKHLVATKKITGFTGNLTGYQFFFIPGATTLNANLAINNVSFFDADLLEDASYLIDNFAEIPAGAVLSFYHNRLCLATTFDDISIILVSAPGEPEAINQISGLIIVPLDGNPITNVQELRDVLYAFKRSRTVSYVDNGDEPSSWPLTPIDNALGTCVHGIATVLDSGSTSVDYLIICNFSGIYLFNGLFAAPELSYKIEAFWGRLDRDLFRLIQILNTPIAKEIYVVMPDRRLLVGNYALGLNPKQMRWTIYSFLQGINTISIWNIDQIIIGSDIPE